MSNFELPYQLVIALNAHGAVLRCKQESLLMRLIGFLIRPFNKAFMTGFWTTIRLPFWGHSVIYYPEADPPREGKWWLVQHELVHAQQLAPWYGPIWVGLLYLLLPLPVFFSGRWFIERKAYLHDIRKGHRSVNGAIDVLWHGYWKPWPRDWMKEWFEAQLQS